MIKLHLNSTPNVHLLISLLLTQFPSGSAINFKNGKLYLVGDDANRILIVTTDYREIGSVKLYDYTEKRIPKADKPDLEAATFLSIEDLEHLLVLGSGSKEPRKIIRLIPLVNDTLDIAASKTITIANFITRVQQSGIEEINFEGLTVFNNKLLLSNRGNLKNTTNHLIFTVTDFWGHQEDAEIRLASLQIPPLRDSIVGVSELHYEKTLDLLLVTLSSEATTNAYDDGAIGNSYLGWIKNFSTKANDKTIAVDKVVCLPEVSPEFEKEKIEGVCVERVEKDAMILHLIADNDAGESKVFRVQVPF